MNSPKEAATYWKRVSETVNYDGVNEWYRARGCCRKFFWTIMMIGTAVAIVYHAYTVTMEYLARPAATKMADRRLFSIPFPQVTICHTARFNRSYVQEKIQVTPQMSQYGLQMGPPDQMSSDFIQWLAYVAYQPLDLKEKGPNLEFLYQYYFNRTASPFAQYDLIKFVGDAALACPKFLVQCAFGAKLFDCCQNAVPIWTDYGTCYQIDIVGRDGSSSQSQPGSSGGLKVWASVNRSEIPVGGFDNDDALRVYFTIDKVNMYDDSVSIPPNKHALINLDAKLYSFDQSIDNCTKTPPPLLMGVKYSRGSCANECMRNLSFTKCGCKILGYGANVQEKEVCPPRVMAECVLPLTMGMTGSTDIEALNEFMDCAYNDCPKLCQQWTYDARTSYQDVFLSPYSTFPYDTPALSNQTTPYVFSAFFGEIKYTELTSAPLWDFNTFICNVGGLVGLWTGMSVITLVQMLVYCYLVPCCYEGEKSETFMVPDSWKSVQTNRHRTYL